VPPAGLCRGPQHYLDARASLAPHLKACLPSTVEQILRVVESKKVAPFLALTLATRPPGSQPSDEPLCALCRETPESPTHLIHHCSGLPKAMRGERAAIIQLRYF
jgi:hypothetical protein